MKAHFEHLDDTRRASMARPALSQTQFDKLRQRLSERIAHRMSPNIVPDPDGIEGDEVLLHPDGWLTEQELMAAAAILIQEKHLDVNTCLTEALKLGVV